VQLEHAATETAFAPVGVTTDSGGCLQDAHLTNGNAVQLIGKVNPDLSVKVLTSLDLGSNIGESARC